jgi:hypothetical protein
MNIRGTILAVVLMAAGCRSVGPTDFRPLEARLEPAAGGPAQYFVLVNTSGHELRNYKFSAVLWNDYNLHATRRIRPFGRVWGSGPSWKPGAAKHFHPWDRSIEAAVTVPVTQVEVVGRCEEGRFHQFWRGTDAGPLVPVGGQP